MSAPRGVLVCPPDHFDVVEAINPHMTGNEGRVDHAAAAAQHAALCAAFEAAGLAVHRLAPDPALPDLVFTANPSLPLRLPDGRRVTVRSRMRHASRAGEVAHHAAFYADHSDESWILADAGPLEGCGDVLPVPGRALLCCGVGPRSAASAHAEIAARTGLVTLPLGLPDPAFYHLDTCLMPLDADTVLWFPEAFAAADRARVEAAFEHRIAADADEARTRLACNAAAGGRRVVVDAQTPRTQAALRAAGFETVPVETGEFLRSGGSVFCLKNWVW